MSGRPLLAVGELSDEHRALLESECTSCGFEPTWTSSVEAAAAKLSATAFDVLLIDLTTPGAAAVCIKARGKLQRGRFPIIALVEEVDESSFVKAFRAGADEAIQLGGQGRLSGRLKDLSRPSRLPPERARGEALLVDPDRTRAEVLERMLADAGYRVDVARDELAAKLNLGRPHVKLVVIDASLPNVRSLFEQSRKKGSRSVWIVRARPDQLAAVTRTFQRGDPVSVVSSFGPPDDILFESNRLLDDSQPAHRAGPRLLHGAIVVFAAGNEPPERGFSYNIGPTGLFVRSLAPPRMDSVSLEITLSGRAAALELQGEVVWRRPFGPTHKQSAPPGFGVRLTAGDLEEWARAFREAYAELHGDFEEPVVREPVDRPLRKPSRPELRAVTSLREKPPTVPVAAEPKLPLTSKPREPMSSVEEMLTEALSAHEHEDAESVPGSLPLAVNTYDMDRVSTVLVSASAESPVAAAPEPEPGRTGSDTPDSLDAADQATLPPSKNEAPVAAQDSHGAPAASAASEADISDQATMRPPAEALVEEPEAGMATDEPFAAGLKSEVPPPDADTLGVSDTPPPPPKPAPVNAFAATMLGLAPPPAPKVSPDAAAEPADAPGKPAAGPSHQAATVVVATSEGGATEAPGGAQSDPFYPRSAGTGAELETEHSTATDVADPAVKRKSASSKLAALAVAVGIVAGIFIALRPARQEEPIDRKPPRADSSGAPTSVEARTPDPAEVPSPRADPTDPEEAPEQPVGTTPDTTGSAPTPESAPTSTGDRTPVAAPSLDDLRADQAYLFVESSLDTHVFVHGVDVGSTNSVLTSRCGTRFVRLGSAPGKWESDGQPLKIRCREMNRIEMP